MMGGRLTFIHLARNAPKIFSNSGLPSAQTLGTGKTVINSPYAERPEGSRNSGLLSVQTFGTVRNISY